MIGWIKLHRSLLEWEWYDDINTTRLFIHCLLRANHKPGKWRGYDIARGEFLTSLQSLSDETGLTVRQIRTSITKLKSTSELTSKATSKLTRLTVCKYDTYQSLEIDSDKQKVTMVTSQRQGSDKVATTNKNNKKEKNEKEDKELELFDTFRKSYPGKKRGNETEFDNLIKKHNDWKIVIPQLSQCLQDQKISRANAKANNQFVPEWKNLSTWINNRCWEEEGGEKPKDEGYRI